MFKRVPNEAGKYGAFTRKEKVRRFPHRHIEFVKYLDEQVLRSSREMREAFRAYFRDRFARCLDPRFRSFAAI